MLYTHTLEMYVQLKASTPDKHIS